MARNSDGSATCDRCGIWLPGYGVLHGMVCTDLDGPNVRSLIFCYRSNCRSYALGNLLAITPPMDGNLRCSHCGVILTARSVAQAMLTQDVQPNVDTPRALAFCYINHSRDLLLANAGL